MPAGASTGAGASVVIGSGAVVGAAVGVVAQPARTTIIKAVIIKFFMAYSFHSFFSL
jgi:hypothetical protein